jgi:SRSO17 transposase
MANLFDDGMDDRLVSFLGGIGGLLKYAKQRAGFAAYATGLMSNSERKSAEPMAALLCPDPEKVDAAHQRLLHFIGQAEWGDAPIREYTARYALDEMTVREAVEAWVVDDTGFIKQGKHSVGVQRQYTGSAGKITNCQIGASLTLTTHTMQLPIDFELYLPQSWTEDNERRKEARIPDSVEFRTKPELALMMAERAVAAGLPKGLVLGDTAYGNNSDFRVGLRKLGLSYGVEIEGSTKVRVIDRRGRAGKERAAREVAKTLGIRCYRRVSWREGSKKTLWSWFASCRVVIDKDAKKLGKREEMWLLIEWPRDESEPTKFTLLTLPKGTSQVSMVRMSRQRWRTERVYEDLKGELGLDHFEGRSFPGWHHHVTVALACYAFTAAEHARSFPPSSRRPRRNGPQRRKAGASLRRFAHHRQAGRGPQHCMLAPALPHMSPQPQPAAPTASATMTQ